MGTEKQNAANAANGKNSRGPKTAAGKARSARNALKHGIRAQKVFLPGNEGVRVAADFFAHFRPVGAYQHGLVMEMVRNQIIIYRCRSVEMTLLASGSSTKNLIALELRNSMKPEDWTSTAAASETSSAEPVSGPQAVQVTAGFFDVVTVTDKDRTELQSLTDNFAQNSEMLDRIRRYRTSAENSLFRTLHELERDKARQNGGQIATPMAVDVGVTTAGAAESPACSVGGQSTAGADVPVLENGSQTATPTAIEVGITTSAAAKPTTCNLGEKSPGGPDRTGSSPVVEVDLN